MKSFVTFASAGPQGLIDSPTAEQIFAPLNAVDNRPDEVIDNCPVVMAYG